MKKMAPATKLGKVGPELFPIGLGLMGLSGLPPSLLKDAEAKNQKLVSEISHFANARNMTADQLLIGYVLAKQPGFVPILGAKTGAQVDDVLGALDKQLSVSDLGELERLIPPDAIVGSRYATEQMKHLDSERLINKLMQS